MTIHVIPTDTDLTSRIIGNPLKQFEDLMNKLSVHLQARQPDLLKKITMGSMQYVALGIAMQVESDDEFWNKAVAEMQANVLRQINYEDGEEEEEEKDNYAIGYDLGFDDARKQIAQFVREWKDEEILSNIADAIDKLEVEESKHASGMCCCAHSNYQHDNKVGKCRGSFTNTATGDVKQCDCMQVCDCHIIASEVPPNQIMPDREGSEPPEVIEGLADEINSDVND